MDSLPPRSPGFLYSPMFPVGERETPWKKLDIEGVFTGSCDGQTVLRIKPEALSELAFQAYHDTSHLLRPGHLAQLRAILDDPEASANDRFVALDLLKNAAIAAAACCRCARTPAPPLVFGKKGQRVWVEGDEEEALSYGVHRTYTETNLRYSQMAPLGMYEEVNTGNNLPVQFDIMAAPGEHHADEFHMQFVAKGGGSANKTFLFQETRAILSPAKLLAYLETKIRTLGTSACPPYHLAIVIGGTSAELTLKTVKLASTRWLDTLPTTGSVAGHAIRDLELEQQVLELTRKIGIGAQFGGKYFCHDVRVIRLPRHGASLPVGIGVSCSADRQILAKITPEGVFLEQLETDPARFLPETTDDALGGEVVKIDLSQPMIDIRRQLSQYPVSTRLSLNGTMVVARDIVHAKLAERLAAGEPMPDYMKNHPVYYAGPAKTPEGFATGSFGPTTAGRMDSYVEQFQAAGGSFVMLAKGNRSRAVRDSCRAHGGFYLGSVGGPAARLAQDCIRKVEVLEYAELGMEAVWHIEVEDFPAFIVVDDKGNDFYEAMEPKTKAGEFAPDAERRYRLGILLHRDRDMRFTVDRLDHIVINCKDVEISASWYQRVLGMEREEFGSESRTALKFGGQKINLRPHDADVRSWITGANHAPGAIDACFITAVGPEDVVDHLHECQVAVEAGPVAKTGALGPMESVYCRDPDGNLIEISSYLPR